MQLLKMHTAPLPVLRQQKQTYQENYDFIVSHVLIS